MMQVDGEGIEVCRVYNTKCGNNSVRVSYIRLGSVCGCMFEDVITYKADYDTHIRIGS